MSVEINLSSPQRRSNPQSAFASATYSKKSSRGGEFESFPVLFHRHRYLLTALALLTFLCIVYLYFAVTLGATDSCSGLSGVQKASCHLKQAKVPLVKGKLKVF
ncbi:hypothetical protein LIER_27267 [Lithospermum erythrorhizon]|uniref:Uncharacterized protein n=1 Tax=Lithospermum erythrorhizon TaxID=34254 RepID=A0AAV3RF09_LITER